MLFEERVKEQLGGLVLELLKKDQAIEQLQAQITELESALSPKAVREPDANSPKEKE